MIENKFKQVYIKIIIKHRELNEEINQQVHDAKQAKTWFLRIHFSANYVNFIFYVITQIQMISHTSQYCMHYRIDMHLVDSRFTRLKTVKTGF